MVSTLFSLIRAGVEVIEPVALARELRTDTDQIVDALLELRARGRVRIWGQPGRGAGALQTDEAIRDLAHRGYAIGVRAT